MESATLAEVVNLPAAQGQNTQTLPVLNLVERDALTQRVERLAIEAKAAATAIETPEDYGAAADRLKDLATAKAEIKALHKEPKDFYHGRHKEVCASEKALIEIIEPLETKIGRTMGAYQAREEEQRKIEAAMIAAQQKAEMDANALELAEGLEESGDRAGAEGVLQAAANMQPEFICESIATHVKGTAVKQNWLWRIVDEKLIPDEYWVLDERKINGVVRAMKDSTKIPGIHAYPETKVHARGR